MKKLILLFVVLLVGLWVYSLAGDYKWYNVYWDVDNSYTATLDSAGQYDTTKSYECKEFQNVYLFWNITATDSLDQIILHYIFSNDGSNWTLWDSSSAITATGTGVDSFRTWYRYFKVIARQDSTATNVSYQMVATMLWKDL